MTKINGLLDKNASDQIDAIKAPLGGKVRKIFDSYKDAKAAFDKAAAAAGDSIPTHAAPKELFQDGINACVAVVGMRQRVGAKMESGIRGLVLFAMPSVDAFVSEAGEWIQKIVEKEAAHVAFRRLRNAETTEEMESAFAEMPADVNAYVTQYTGDGLDTDAFDAIWSPMRAALKESMPALASLLPQKGEVLKSIRSAAYARDEHPELEEKGVFVFLGKSAINGCAGFKDAEGNDAPIDASAIVEWLAKRDELVLATRKPQEKDFSQLAGLDLGLGAETDEGGQDESE